MDGLVLNSGREQLGAGVINFPALPNLMTGGGFSIEMWITANSLDVGQSIISTFGPKHKGLEVSLVEKGAIRIRIHDGEMRDQQGPYSNGQTFISDEGVINENELHHIVFIIDGASGIATIVVDGVLSDGEVKTRPYGWGRIHTFMQDLNDTYTCKIHPDFKGELQQLRVYNRYLRTSEAIRNYHNGRAK